MLRVVIVGLGMMGRNHVRVVRSLDDIELIAVVDPVGDPHNAAREVPLLGSIEEALEHRPDAVILATPTETHESAGLLLAEAQIATLIEKPLAADVAAGARLVAAFAEAGVPAAVGHIERFNGAVRSMKERLGRRELGELYQIATFRQGPFPSRISDVGVIKDLATHDIDLTAWVSGQAFGSVSARTAHRAGRPNEDLVAVVGCLTDGTVTNHLVNWLSPMKERRVVVTGERGSFVADTLTADLTFFANASVPAEWDAISRFRGVSEGDMIRYAIAKPEPLRVELESFFGAVRGTGTGHVTLEEGLATLRVAEAVAEAAVRGTTVEIGPT
jgi:UDP-N-acetylglucosamine 3-dehydrogenase